MSSSVVDGTIAATLSTVSFEILNQLINNENERNDFSFNPDHGYKLAYLKPQPRPAFDFLSYPCELLASTFSSIVWSYRAIGPILFFLMTLAVFSLLFLVTFLIENKGVVDRRMRKGSRRKGGLGRYF